MAQLGLHPSKPSFPHQSTFILLLPTPCGRSCMKRGMDLSYRQRNFSLTKHPVLEANNYMHISLVYVLCLGIVFPSSRQRLPLVCHPFHLSRAFRIQTRNWQTGQPVRICEILGRLTGPQSLSLKNGTSVPQSPLKLCAPFACSPTVAVNTGDQKISNDSIGSYLSLYGVR